MVLQREAGPAQDRAEENNRSNDAPHCRSDVGQLSDDFGAVFTVAGVFINLPTITGRAGAEHRSCKVGKSWFAV